MKVSGTSAPVRSGLRILVAEDETMLMMMLEDILQNIGCLVTSAGRLASALEAAEGTAFDGAILDINLGGEPIYPVARVLKRRGIPFIFATGYEKESVPAEFSGLPVLAKPYLSEDVDAVGTEASASEPGVSLASGA